MATKLVVMCGVNDIIAGESGSDLWDEMQTFLEARIAAGIVVVPVTITPFKNYTGWTSGKETQRDAYNTLLLSWCASNPMMAHCIDSRASSAGGGLADPGDNDASDPAFDYGDGLHYSAAGNVRIASLIAAGW
jgi:hypothetical protein